MTSESLTTPTGFSRRRRVRNSCEFVIERWLLDAAPVDDGIEPTLCLFARRDDLVEVIGRALDAHQMRVLQAAVVIHRHGAEAALYFNSSWIGALLFLAAAIALFSTSLE